MAALGAALAQAARQRLAQGGLLPNVAARALGWVDWRADWRCVPEPGLRGQPAVGPSSHLQPAACEDLRLCGVHGRRAGAARHPKLLCTLLSASWSSDLLDIMF